MNDRPAEAPGDTTSRRRKRLAAAGGALVAIAGLAVPIHHFATQRESAPDTLQDPDALRTEPAADPVEDPVLAAGEGGATLARYEQIEGTAESDELLWFQWHVTGGSLASDLPLAEFPVSEPDPTMWGCTDEQLAWLDANGVPTPGTATLDKTYLLVNETLHNTATSGGALSVRNIRVEGEFADQQPPRFQVACLSGGYGEIGPPIFALATIGDPTPAVFIENTEAADFFPADQLVPADLIGTPVTINLQPGEEASMFLFLDTVDPSRDFIGRVVSDVVVGSETFEYVLREGYLQTTEPVIDDVHVIAGFGSLYCLPDAETFTRFQSSGMPEDLEPYRCTPQELADRVAAAVG